MTYKQIKWIILILPTLTVFLWEELRHTQFMLDFLPMHIGNWLTPIIVFIVTMVIARRLFLLLEKNQQQLEEERAYKLLLHERESYARQLHDGIAQSLFLISVKLNKLEKKQPELVSQSDYQKVKKTVQHIHQDVRQSIFNLRKPVSSIPYDYHWTQTIHELVKKFKEETDMEIEIDWKLPVEKLTEKERLELILCIKEALMNAHKHANCQTVSIHAEQVDSGWICFIEDDGNGFKQSNQNEFSGHGLEIMKDRTKEMNWQLCIERLNDKTRISIISK